MRPTLPRLFAALPDAITSGVFATTWVAPAVTGIASVDRLTQVMLMEFIVVHSTVFYALIAAAGEVARGKRLVWLAGLSSLYLLFVVGFAIADHSTWPLFAFAWLFVSRFAHIWTRPVQSAAETSGMVKLWLASVLAYLFGALLTSLLPLPRLGMTPEIVGALQQPGSSGEWVERPQAVLAFGMLYFAIQAWIKYLLAGPAPATADVAPDVLAQRVARIAKLVSEQAPKS